ncbi:hypothetical protein L1887_14620 [Cichorium endivia]|nr:hypothetical protein L1887_14620 [Cichorium endivia]
MCTTFRRPASKKLSMMAQREDHMDDVMLSDEVSMPVDSVEINSSANPIDAAPPSSTPSGDIQGRIRADGTGLQGMKRCMDDDDDA